MFSGFELGLEPGFDVVQGLVVGLRWVDFVGQVAFGVVAVEVVVIWSVNFVFRFVFRVPVFEDLLCRGVRER